jgi:hypothetical protein
MELKKGILMPLLFLSIFIFKYLILSSGDHFVSGGGDKVLKLWGYDDGMCYYTGIGHSGAIIKVK